MVCVTQPIHTQPDDDRGLSTDMDEGTLLEIKGLKAHFLLDEGVAKAVDGVSLTLKRGETLGIVGESGSGKSVTARSILQILGSGGKIVDGQILYRRNGQVTDLAGRAPTGGEIRSSRGNDIAMVFQEPMTAFSPVYTVGRQISEAIRIHNEVSKRAARERTVELLRKVGIQQPERRVDAYPFELSGGMRQRAMIAMALACDPQILIADEPTTALDVTIQAQILALMKSIQEETGMSIIIISHNMGVIAEMADTVAVMYLGRHLGDHPHVVADDNYRHPSLFLDALHERQDLGLNGDVEGGGRLVGYEYLRVAGQCHGDHGPLAHPPGELEGIRVHPALRLLDADLPEQLDGALARGPLRDLVVDPDGLRDLAPHGVDRGERGHRLLEDHRDVVAPAAADLPARRGAPREVGDLPVAAVEDLAVHDLPARAEDLQDRAGRDALAAA